MWESTSYSFPWFFLFYLHSIIYSKGHCFFIFIFTQKHILIFFMNVIQSLLFNDFVSFHIWFDEIRDCKSFFLSPDYWTDLFSLIIDLNTDQSNKLTSLNVDQLNIEINGNISEIFYIKFIDQWLSQILVSHYIFHLYLVHPREE